MNKQMTIGITLFGLLIVIMIFIYFASKQISPLNPIASNGVYNTQNYGNGNNKYVNMPVEIADPGYIPNGTTSVSVIFNNVSIYVHGKGWQGGGGFGPVNLLSVRNQSEIISVISIPYNATVEKVSMQIGSAQIAINGRTYNLTPTNNQIYTQLSPTYPTNNSVLVDISPIILAPSSARTGVQMRYYTHAFILNNRTGFLYAGKRYSNNQNFSASHSFVIKNASIITGDNLTRINIGLSSASTTQTTIDSVIIIGNESFAYNNTRLDQLSRTYANMLINKYVQSVAKNGSGNGIGALIFNISGNGNIGNTYSSINPQIYSQAISIADTLGSIVLSNLTSLFKLGGPLSKSITAFGFGPGSKSVNITSYAQLNSAFYSNVRSAVYNATSASSALQSKISAIPFAVGSDGSLQESWISGAYGAVLNPQSSLQLNFYSNMALGNVTYIKFIRGGSYKIIVTSIDGTFATYLVNAG